MDKLLMESTVSLFKLPADAGTQGILMVHQDEVGGHLLTFPDVDVGNIVLSTVPHGVTLVRWYRDDVRTYWSSEIITPDSPINPPSTVTDLRVDLVDTISAKLSWTSPEGIEGEEFVKADVYKLVLSTSELPPEVEENLGTTIPIQPKIAGMTETYIVPRLESNKRYYAAIYVQTVSYGKLKLSALSNIITFLTSDIGANVNIPKRIPLHEEMIWQGTVNIGFDFGKYFTDYRDFRKLAHQDTVIDNNGIPSAPPVSPVTVYDNYSSHQTQWYNVTNHKVMFELDGEYDLDYIYFAQDNNSVFNIYTSYDGVNLIPAYEGGGFVSGWRKIELAAEAKTGVKYIYLGLGKSSGNIFGFIPYGTKKTPTILVGEKFKRVLNTKTVNDSVGTNMLLAETQYDWVSEVSSFARIYVESDWIVNGVWRNTGGGVGKTPDDIELRANVDGMWNWDTAFQELLDLGHTNLCFTLVRSFGFLRTQLEAPSDSNNYKPLDPGLNTRDMAVTTNPQSYKFFSRLMSSLAYRWGFNTDSDDVFNQFVPNDGQKGMGLVRYYEWGNENDKHWESDQRYYHPFEAAAIMSAVYDGHKGALGAGYGIKNADPNAKLVMAGMYYINTAYIRFMMLWWDANRGVGDYPIDVLNFHHYNTYVAQPNIHRDVIYGWGLQEPSIAYGVQPEGGTLLHETHTMNRFRSLYMPNKEVACTEWGYGEQFRGSTSPQDADRYKRGEHKSVWLLRTIMIYLAAGLDFLNHYWYAGGSINVDDLRENTPGAINQNITAEAFYTSGLVEGTGWASDWVRKKSLAAWWYMTSFRNAMAGYTYSHTVVREGVQMTNEPILTTYNPYMWAMAFINHDTGESVIVAWLGTDNWMTQLTEIKLANTATVVPVTDFEEQYLRLSTEGVTTDIVPTVTAGVKTIQWVITETPVIIKTTLIGVPNLIKPFNVSSMKMGQTSIKVTWTDENIGLNKARIYYSTSPLSGFTLAEEEYRDNAETTITGLLPNTSYYFRVQFSDEGTVSEISDTTSSKTGRALNPPTSLIQISATSSTVLLGWSFPVLEENTITEYVLYRSSTENGVYQEVARILPGLREYRDYGLVPSNSYYYKLKTYNDGSESVFSFAVAGTTTAPSYEPPTVQSIDTSITGDSIELYFDEEMKDEQTAINAFSIIETFAGRTIYHPITAISIPSGNRSKVILKFDVQIFKTSSVTVSYSASMGGLQSLYNLPVNTFTNYVVTNNVAVLYNPVYDFNELYNIAVNGNNLIGTGWGNAVAQVKILAGETSILQWNVEIDNGMIVGLDQNADPESYSSMDYYTRKYSGKQEWKIGGTSGLSAQTFGAGLMRFRTNGTTIYFEHSTDGGITWVSVQSVAQPNIDLYVKMYCESSGQKLNNLVGINLEGSSSVIVPDAPTAMTVDDELNLVGFTLNPSYPLGEHEYTTNYSSFSPNWLIVPSNPIAIGDVNIPSGDFAIRIREATDRAASPALVSDVDITGTINSSSPIMVQKSSGGTVLAGLTTLPELTAWLATASITEAITVQFNTQTTYLLTGEYNPAYTNGTNWVTFQGAAGVRPVFDVQELAGTVWNARSYTVFRNMAFINGDLEAGGATLIRADQRHHCKFLDLVFDRGFCCIRATDGGTPGLGIHDFEIDNITVRNVWGGSFRINGEITNPMANMSIKNIKLDDTTGAAPDAAGKGGVIAGSADRQYSPALVLKLTNGYVVENIRPVANDYLYDMGEFENCSDVVAKNIMGRSILILGSLVDGTGTNIKLINCYFPGAPSYMYALDGLDMIHCRFKLFIYQCKNLRKFRGNMFLEGLYGNLMTPADMPLEENNNLIIADSTTDRYVEWTFPSDPDFAVTEANKATYKLTRGQNTLFIPYLDRATVNINPFGSLRAGSVGEGLITGVLEATSDDLYTVNRVYPTDPGPFSGLRPDQNDQPVPVTVTADNLARTLVFTHVLGMSEIVFSTNGGPYLPYTGVINVGDLALSANYYMAKTKSAPYRNESVPVGSPAFTDTPVSDYEVLQTMEINFKGFYGASSGDANINNYAPDPVDDITESVGLINVTGASSGITMSGFELGFQGSTSGALPSGSYIRSSVAMETALEMNSSNPLAKVKFTGLDNSKFYQFYIVSCSQYSDHETTVRIGATTVIIPTGTLSPLAVNGDFHSNPAVTKINDRVPSGGELVLEIEKTGSGWQTVVINYLIIEETTTAKPV